MNQRLTAPARVVYRPRLGDQPAVLMLDEVDLSMVVDRVVIVGRGGQELSEVTLTFPACIVELIP